MARAPFPNPRDFETLFRVGALGSLTDRLLLDQFLGGGDAAGPAFEQIVARYGPMVLGVCRRVAGDDHVAEDAFQAAFLVLALRAGAIRRRESLGPWLHGVAARVARRSRDAATRRMRHEVPGPLPEAAAPGGSEAEAETEEVRRVLDEELGRLPGKYRDPLVLCYLEGRSQEEAARVLGWTKGTVSGRLARAKDLLRSRLARRGLAPAIGAFPPLAELPVSPAAVSSDLVATAVRGGLAATVGRAEAAGIPASVLEQAKGAIWTMSAIRWVSLSSSLTLILLASAAAWSLAAHGNGPPRPASTASLDDPLPAGATLRFGSPLFRHTTTIQSLAVSPDGKVAVAASGTLLHGSVRAYDLATGQVRLTFDRGVTDVEAVALSPDGKTLAMTRNAVPTIPAVYLHDMTSGRETARIPYPAADTGSTGDLLLFAPDGRHLVVKAADGKALHLLGLATGGVVRTYPNAGTVFAAALSPDGKHLIVGGFDYEKGERFARRWEVDTGRELGPLPLSKGTVRCVAYAPDGATIALGVEARPPAVTLVEAATGDERLEIRFPDASRIRSVAFSPDGHTLAASGGSTTRLFDTTTGRERARIRRRAIGLRFAPDGATLVGAVAGTIDRWDVATGKSLIPDGGDSPVKQIAATADGKRIITLGQDGDAHIWDALTGEHQRRVDVREQHGFALSPDGRFLVWPEADGEVEFPDADLRGVTRIGCRLRMMGVATGTRVERFGSFEGDAYDLFFTDGGQRLVTVDRYHRDAGVRIWNVATGEVERSFAAEWKPESRVWHSRLSPDGKVLALGYQGKERGLVVEYEVKLWDIATGKEVAAPRPLWFAPEVLAITPDGKTIAVARPDGTIRFQDATTGQKRGDFQGQRDRVTAFAFGPSGPFFSGTLDGTVMAWDPRVATPLSSP